MNEEIKINWYRTKVDRKVMSDLMRRDDRKALFQCLLHIAFVIFTGALSYLAWRNIHFSNWQWALPLLLCCLFLHGTVGSFMGLIAVHELCHKTPFKNQKLNEVFLNIFSFFSWSDKVAFRVSHVKHHQATVHHDHDGEVMLPQKLNWDSLLFVLTQLTCNPMDTIRKLRFFVKASMGNLNGLSMFDGGEWWLKQVLPKENTEIRRRHRNWARTLVLGHLLLALLFLSTGNWFLIAVVSFPNAYARWFTTVCSAPQHIGMTPDVPDFRLSCRTYTCGMLPSFLYWNMQYHVEHHMFPAIPFYNLPKLREEIKHDLPSATHGLIATWREIIPILKRQRIDHSYSHLPEIQGS